MCLSFQNILIPVDFTINTEFAVKNALVLSDPCNAVIHLFHVENKTQPFLSASSETRLLQIKENIQEAYEYIQVEIHIISGGTVQSQIIRKARELKTDLIIIVKHNDKNWFTLLNALNSSLIAKKTNCAVLNIRVGTILHKIRSVVMPIRSFFPTRKIALLPALTRKQRPVIHLVTVQRRYRRAVYSKVFTDTYRHLSGDLHYPVNHKMITGNNYAGKIMKYAMNIEADLIMVNPFDETALNFLGMHINDMTHQQFNVLTIAPLPIEKSKYLNKEI